MTVFDVIRLAGGLAFFLYGMNVMSGALEKMAGGKLEKTLNKMTSNILKSLLLGAGITIAIQSSSALTVMLVGLVNSGIMKLAQTVGVIMGSNIGTTLTAWILSLTSLESDNVWLGLCKPENFSLVFALLGIIMVMASKKTRRRDIGTILLGFAVLMYGMELMKGSVSDLTESENFKSLLTAFNNPLLGVLVGTVFTGVIQSSAASVGILQALSMTGAITYGMAIPIIMGQNIGTCVTSLLSSIGVNKNAKRVAVIHISFNIIGTSVCLILFYAGDIIFNFAFKSLPIDAFGIALCHTVFNVFTTILLIPFRNWLVRIASVVIRDKKAADEYSFIDERLLNTPSFATSESDNMTKKMAVLAYDTILSAVGLISDFSSKLSQKIRSNEELLDTYEDKLGSFLVRLSSKNLSDSDSRLITKQLHTIGDFERIGDHALNLLDAAEEIHDKKTHFSPEAQNEIDVLTSALCEICNITLKSFTENDLELAAQVEPLEQVIDSLIAEIKVRHIERLRRGECTIEIGFILSDILTNFERVSDHCSNVAVALIEVEHGSFDTHEYLNSVKNSENTEFVIRYNKYKDFYVLK